MINFFSLIIINKLNFSYDEFIYHAISKQNNYILMQLNLNNAYENIFNRDDKIYLKCLEEELGKTNNYINKIYRDYL